MLHFSNVLPPSLYVDPGSGALLWQSLCAIIAGAAFSFRGIFKMKKNGSVTPDQQQKSE